MHVGQLPYSEYLLRHVSALMAPLRHCPCCADSRVLPKSAYTELQRGWGYGARCEHEADERQQCPGSGKEIGNCQQINHEAQSTSSEQAGRIVQINS